MKLKRSDAKVGLLIYGHVNQFDTDMVFNRGCPWKIMKIENNRVEVKATSVDSVADTYTFPLCSVLCIDDENVRPPVKWTYASPELLAKCRKDGSVVKALLAAARLIDRVGLVPFSGSLIGSSHKDFDKFSPDTLKSPVTVVGAFFALDLPLKGGETFGHSGPWYQAALEHLIDYLGISAPDADEALNKWAAERDARRVANVLRDAARWSP